LSISLSTVETTYEVFNVLRSHYNGRTIIIYNVKNVYFRCLNIIIKSLQIAPAHSSPIKYILLCDSCSITYYNIIVPSEKRRVAAVINKTNNQQRSNVILFEITRVSDEQDRCCVAADQTDRNVIIYVYGTSRGLFRRCVPGHRMATARYSKWRCRRRPPASEPVLPARRDQQFRNIRVRRCRRRDRANRRLALPTADAPHDDNWKIRWRLYVWIADIVNYNIIVIILLFREYIFSAFFDFILCPSLASYLVDTPSAVVRVHIL